MYNLHALKYVIFINICLLYIYICIDVYYIYVYMQFFQRFFHRLVRKILDGNFLYNAYHFL